MPSRIDEQLRAKGYDPDAIRESMRRYIGEGRAFASPGEYQEAIHQKQAEGIPLDDPYTAQAFQEAIAPSMKPASTTEFHFSGGPIPNVEGLRPEAHDMLNMVMEHQRANPISLPVSPGTPTRWQIQDEEAMRAQAEAERMTQEKWEYGQERDLIADERWQMQWDREEQWRREDLANRMAIARMSGSRGVTGGVGTGETARMDPGTLRSLSSMTDTPMTWDVNRPPKQIQAAVMDEAMSEMDPMQQIRSLVQFVIEDGGTWTDIQNAIDRQEPMLRQQKVSMSEALNWAMSEYELLIGGARPNRFQDSFLGGFAPDPNLMSLGKDKSSAFNRSIRDPYHEALQKEYIGFNVPMDDRLYGKD